MLAVGIASLSMSSVPAQAVEQGYPLDQVLETFGTACSGVENGAVNRASALAAGWQDYSPSPDTVLGQLIATGKKVVAEEQLEEGESPTELIDNGVYRGSFAGRGLFLVLSGARVDNITTTGCRIYDVDAVTAPDAEMLSSWARRAPDDIRRPLEGVLQYYWNGGLKPGHFDMEISFVQPGTKLPFEVSLSGLALTVTNVEIEDL